MNKRQSYLADTSSSSKHDRPVNSQQFLHQEAKPDGIHSGHKQVKVRYICAVLEWRNDLFPWFKAACVKINKVAEKITWAWQLWIRQIAIWGQISRRSFDISKTELSYGLHCSSFTLTSCVSENKSLVNVSKASIEVSIRLPPTLHRNTKRNVVQMRECSLFVSMLKSGPPFSGKKKLSRRQHIVVTLFMSTWKRKKRFPCRQEQTIAIKTFSFLKFF